MDCTIAGISQEMNLEENVTTTFLLLRLPDGQQVRAAIDDAAAVIVVAMSVAEKGQPRPAVSAPMAPMPAPISERHERHTAVVQREPWPEENGHAKTAETEEDAPRIFGEQDGGDEPSPEYQEPPPVVASPPHGSNFQRLPNGRVIVPSKNVPKTEYGYPIVPGGGVDPSTLTSPDGQDEDGVGSV